MQQQARIYSNFDAGMAQACAEGAKADPVLTEQKGGYLVALRPSDEVLRTVVASTAAFAEMGMFPYNARLHTTAFDYKVAAGFDPDKDPDRQQIMGIFMDIADEVVPTSPVDCLYEGFAFNRTTLIIKGLPSRGFFDLAQTLVNRANAHGIEVKMPWGGHITAGRFQKPVEPAVLKGMRDTLQNVHFPTVRQAFTELRVGQFISTKNSFDVTWIAAFPLPH